MNLSCNHAVGVRSLEYRYLAEIKVIEILPDWCSLT
jgi:hypothetical protein